MQQSLIKLATLIIGGLALFTGSTSYASDVNDGYECPQKIAVIEGDPISFGLVPVLSDLYDQLGCKIRFVTRPAQRGIAEFNKQEVDGELFRLPLIGKSYKIPYIQSDFPLVVLQHRLFEQAETKVFKKKITGFAIGIKWQELYVKQHNNRDVFFFPYNSEQELIKAFNRKDIHAFLGDQQSVDLWLSSGKLAEQPKAGQIISELKLYHFLNARFSKVMMRLNELVEAQQPFMKK